MVNEKLPESTGYINYPDIQGYLTLIDANRYVASGKWQFHSVSCWGYVIERKK